MTYRSDDYDWAWESDRLPEPGAQACECCGENTVIDNLCPDCDRCTICCSCLEDAAEGYDAAE